MSAVKAITVGIDASNLRMGGGRTHLIELLRAAPENIPGVKRVLVWGSRSTLDCLGPRPWLEKIHVPALEGSLPRRVAWQQFELPRQVVRRVDLLFSPGGRLPSVQRPRVVMCQNMLPFEASERRRYGLTLAGARLQALRLLQGRSFADAEGVIFLSNYAQTTVSKQLPQLPHKSVVIPHGVHQRFFVDSRRQRAIADYSPSAPFRLLYVSHVTRYKHQDIVAQAVAALRRHFPVTLDLAGPPSDVQMTNKLAAIQQRLDPQRRFIRCTGAVDFDAIHRLYGDADAFVFASSCENMPNILLEAMASSLPIACSDRGPMPEVLGDAGIYFDPENVGSLQDSLTQLIESPERRHRWSQQAWRRAQAFSWERCATDTFAFLVGIAATEVCAKASSVPPNPPATMESIG